MSELRFPFRGGRLRRFSDHHQISISTIRSSPSPPSDLRHLHYLHHLHHQISRPSQLWSAASNENALQWEKCAALSKIRWSDEKEFCVKQMWFDVKRCGVATSGPRQANCTRHKTQISGPVVNSVDQKSCDAISKPSVVLGSRTKSSKKSCVGIWNSKYLFAWQT